MHVLAIILFKYCDNIKGQGGGKEGPGGRKKIPGGGSCPPASILPAPMATDKKVKTRQNVI